MRCEQGRVVYGNIKKVILYLFATSVDEVLVLLLALLFGYPLPLAAVQILWINLVTEGTLTVNLVMEPPDGDEMRRHPVATRRAAARPPDAPAHGADGAHRGGRDASAGSHWRLEPAACRSKWCTPRPSRCWRCASGSTC